MNELALVLVALFGMLGTGGVIAALTNMAIARRREGVRNAPGDVLFAQTNTFIGALQTQMGAMAQQIANMGSEIIVLREALSTKDEQVAELRGLLKAAQQQAEETEFHLNEERRARAIEENQFRAEIVTLHAEIARLREGGAS